MQVSLLNVASRNASEIVLSLGENLALLNCVNAAILRHANRLCRQRWYNGCDERAYWLRGALGSWRCGPRHSKDAARSPSCTGMRVLVDCIEEKKKRKERRIRSCSVQ